MNSEHKILVDELKRILLGGNAHVSLKDAVKGLPRELRSVKPPNIPYSIWQLIEHMRIAQWDMLQFCKDGNHKSPKWPEEYWPKQNAPKNDSAWDESLRQIDADLDEFIELIKRADLYQPIQHGAGQNVLLEALQVADHNAYHIGEIITLRRMMGDWK
ncbi:MAG: DinB family protein [Bacteroidota bacterium]|nr:DinB family protein [Bacteroidota bacterium]